ncbi:MAG: PAS domain S-box protein [Planctomycetota bacterium]
MADPTSLIDDSHLLRSIIEASPAGMIITDADGVIVLANPSALMLFGFEANELVGSSVDRLVPETHRPTHHSHRARYMDHPENRPMAAGRNLYAQRKDGSVFPVDISLHPIQMGGRPMVLANVLDATDRQRAEQEREQRQAMEKLALLGQLAGGVAHEIRTPLCVIRNDAYYLKLMEDRLGEEGMQCINEINVAVGKAERIVSELLDFTRDPAYEPVDKTLSDLIESAIRAIGLPDSVSIDRQGDHSLLVRVDPDQIERVLINLIRNASEAMDGAGVVKVNVGSEVDAAFVEIVDEGPGMLREHVSRVFEPLFSTKPKGIGLGLAVSKRYAERNGGTLTASNLPHQQGAQFRLTVPLSERG